MCALQEHVRVFMITSPWILLRLRNVDDKMRRECQNAHFMFSKFSSENVPFMT
jgi:hypothetical protein